jgi:hypothetical protein
MINKLASVFQQYKTFPKECYNAADSPVQIFIKMFPNDSYAHDLKAFISLQEYKPTQAGSDLPWWGKKYFSNEDGFRVFIVAQDSNANDAESIVFYSHLFPSVKTNDQYRSYTSAIKHKDTSKKSFSFKSYIGVRNKITEEWGLNLDFLYITDAAKVYRYNSWEKNDFDFEKSKSLLKDEIKFCNPNLIILLGWKALRILDETQSFKNIVESHSFLKIEGRQIVVAPFLCGQGLSQPNFKQRFENAKFLINEAIHGI